MRVGGWWRESEGGREGELVKEMCQSGSTSITISWKLPVSSIMVGKCDGKFIGSNFSSAATGTTTNY